MKRFIEGADRTQVSLLPECVEDYVAEDNPVRVIEAFVEQLDLRQMGFEAPRAAAFRRRDRPASSSPRARAPRARIASSRRAHSDRRYTRPSEEFATRTRPPVPGKHPLRSA